VRAATYPDICIQQHTHLLTGPVRRAVRGIAALAAISFATQVMAEPFVVESMPAGFDGVYFTTGSLTFPNYDAPALTPVAVDFNGDGQTSWYAGGKLAHAKTPTPLDPERYSIASLPLLSLPVCPSCTPRSRAFAVGDINRDGHPDIIRLNDWVGQSNTYTLQVFQGVGDNTFTVAWREDFVDNPAFNTGDPLFQMTLTDLDRDGDLDLALLSTYQYTNHDVSPPVDAGSLRIRWNTLGGQFGTQTVLQGQHFSSNSNLYVQDFDQDGDADILVNFSTIWAANNTYSIYANSFTNSGVGTFSYSSDARSEFYAPVGFVDLNRDAFPDYLYFNGSGLAWIPNDRTGIFGGALGYGGAVPAGQDLAFADFDEDGLGDLISGETVGGQNALVLRRGLANTTLAAAQTLAVLPSEIVQMAVGDARGDADADVLLRLADGTFRLARNQAQRLDPDRGTSVVATSQSGLSKLAVVDMNRDGVDDLLALQTIGGSKAYLALGNTGGGFNPAEFKILASGASDMAVGDFNRDGKPDFAYVAPGSGQVRTVTQIDNILFSWTDATIGTYAGASLIRAGSSFINDAKTDLVVSSNTTGGLRWFVNPGSSAAWTNTTPVATQSPIPQGLALIPHYIGFGDAAMSCAANGQAFYVNGYSNVLGWFLSASLLQVQTIQQTGVCASVNIDNDAEKELVFVSGNGRLVWWNPESNAIVTTTTIANSVPGLVNAIAAVDWNTDGLNDLLVATSQGLYLYAREGLAEGWVQHELYADALLGVTDVVAIDVNRDGRSDAAFINGGSVRVLPNTSRVVAATAGSYPAGSPLMLTPGAAGTAFDVGIVNPGRLDEDARIAVMGTSVVFNKAVQSGGVWSKGATMTSAEVQQAVTSVSIKMDGLVIGTSATTLVAADGSLRINYNSVLGNLVPIGPGETKQLTVAVTLKPTAGSASYTNFYLSHANTLGLAQVLHGTQAVGRTGAFGGEASNRVSFDPVVQGEIFKNGFE
jgi:hypothetical protein